MRAAMIPIAITRTQNISSKGRAILLINIRAEVTSSNGPYVHFNYLVSQTNAECCSAFDRPRRQERFHNPSTHRTREKTDLLRWHFFCYPPPTASVTRPGCQLNNEPLSSSDIHLRSWPRPCSEDLIDRWRDHRGVVVIERRAFDCAFCTH